jgi:hypothetical protein
MKSRPDTKHLYVESVFLVDLLPFSLELEDLYNECEQVLYAIAWTGLMVNMYKLFSRTPITLEELI